MSKKKTCGAIVLDSSGSMGRTKKAAIDGYNEHVQQFKMNAEDQDLKVSVITFNGNVMEHLWAEDASKLTEASDEDYKPGGGTAMRDAIGYTIQKFLDTTDYSDPDTSYLIIIISDGETNPDTRYGIPALREMVQSCEATGRWTFAYLGCSASYLQEVARQTGVALSNMAVWDNSTVKGTKMGMARTAERTGNYLRGRAMGLTASNTYMNDEQDKLADFTGYNQVNDNSNDLSDAGHVGDVVRGSVTAPNFQWRADANAVMPGNAYAAVMPEVLLRDEAKPEPTKVVRPLDDLKKEKAGTYGLRNTRKGNSVFSSSSTVEWK